MPTPIIGAVNAVKHHPKHFTHSTKKMLNEFNPTSPEKAYTKPFYKNFLADILSIKDLNRNDAIQNDYYKAISANLNSSSASSDFYQNFKKFLHENMPNLNDKEAMANLNRFWSLTDKDFDVTKPVAPTVKAFLSSLDPKEIASKRHYAEIDFYRAKQNLGFFTEKANAAAILANQVNERYAGAINKRAATYAHNKKAQTPVTRLSTALKLFVADLNYRHINKLKPYYDDFYASCLYRKKLAEKDFAHSEQQFSFFKNISSVLNSKNQA